MRLKTKKNVILYYVSAFILIILLFIILFVNQTLSQEIEDENFNFTEEIIGNEVLEKRTYNSRTFKNPDGSFTTEIGLLNLFFYNGSNYVSLSKLSYPTIEKKEIYLTKYPRKNVFEFGSYTLNNGVNATIENDKFVVRDSNGKVVKSLQRPFSIDSKGDISLDNYILETNANKIELFVQVDKKWLKSAEYPVIIDPTETLSNITGIYDGDVYLETVNTFERQDKPDDDGTFPRINVGVVDTSILGEDFDIFRGFIEFNTSTIEDGVSVSDVDLNLTVSTAYAQGNNVSITRFNNSQISSNSTYPRNNTGNSWLYNNISDGRNGLGRYITNSTSFQTTGAKTFDLGATADQDIIDGANTRDFFAIGFFGTFEAQNAERFTKIDANASKLIVTYSGGSCSPAGGDFSCNSTCTWTDQVVDLDADLFIRDKCVLTLQGTTDVNFVGAGSRIFVYSQGVIYIKDTAGFNKP